jgi:hypothetical protein
VLGTDSTGALMKKYQDAGPPPQTARANRERLAPVERPAIMQEIAKRESDVRMNMARLRELRLAKEAQEVGTEISTGNQPTKAKPRALRRFP